MPKRELSKEFKDRIGHPPTHTSKNIVKKEERIAKAREKGRIEGEYAAHDKKSFMLEIKEHFGHVIHNTKMNDWVEIIAAVGITPIIHDAISVSENVLTFWESRRIGRRYRKERNHKWPFRHLYHYHELGSTEFSIPNSKPNSAPCNYKRASFMVALFLSGLHDNPFRRQTPQCWQYNGGTLKHYGIVGCDFTLGI